MTDKIIKKDATGGSHNLNKNSPDWMFLIGKMSHISGASYSILEQDGYIGLRRNSVLIALMSYSSSDQSVSISFRASLPPTEGAFVASTIMAHNRVILDDEFEVDDHGYILWGYHARDYVYWTRPETFNISKRLELYLKQQLIYPN